MQQNKPQVSVIVPAYNVEKTLKRCIDSILTQTFQDFELLIVDDGATDSTPALCDEIEKTDGRITVIHQENRGLSGARNTGMRAAKGDYFTFLDSDDFCDGTMLEKLVEAAKENNAEYVGCGFVYYYGQNDKSEAARSAEGRILSKHDAVSRLLDDAGFCSAWGKLYARRLWDKLQYPEEIRYAEDMRVAHLLIEDANKVVFIDEKLYFYSQENESLTRSGFNAKKLEMLGALEMWTAHCRENYPDLTEKAEAYYDKTLTYDLALMAGAGENALYGEYRKLLKGRIKSLTGNSLLTGMDKIKAVSAVMLNAGGYRTLRKILGH